MLETVKKTMKSLPDIEFSKFYTCYMMEVQDTDIDNEMSTLVRCNSLDTHVLGKLIALNYKEMSII